MAVFWFNFLNRHLGNKPLSTIVRATLDSGDTSPPLTLSTALQDFVHGGPLTAFHGRSGESRAGSVKPLLSFIAVSMLVFGGFTRVALINLLASLCFELAQGCSVDKLYCKRLSCRLSTICVTVKQSALLHWCKRIHPDFLGTVVLEHTLSLTS